MSESPRVALITGAGGGIGAAVANRLASDGMAVGLLDLNETAAVTATKAITDTGGTAEAIRCDVSDESEVNAAVDRAISTWGRVDILVHCAGVIRDNLLFKMSNSDWDLVLATHLTSAFYLSRAVQSHMVNQKYGKIVFLSSEAALGSRGQTNYAAAKAGLEGMTKTLAIELGKFNVNVNAVAPGFVETPMTRAAAQRLNMDYEQFKARSAEKNALKRVAIPEDIANVIGFLVSDESRALTGQVLLARFTP